MKMCVTNKRIRENIQGSGVGSAIFLILGTIMALALIKVNYAIVLGASIISFVVAITCYIDWRYWQTKHTLLNIEELYNQKMKLEEQ